MTKWPKVTSEHFLWKKTQKPVLSRIFFDVNQNKQLFRKLTGFDGENFVQLEEEFLFELN